MAISRKVRGRRIAEDIAFFAATVALAWWAIDHEPSWLMAVCVGGAFAVAFGARWLLVRSRARHI